MSVDRKFQGYCARCHELREVTSGSFCPVCTSPLMDLHEVVGAEAMAGTARREASQIGDSSDARAPDAHSFPPQTPAGWAAPSSPPPAATPGTQGRQPPRRRVLIALFAILALVIAAVHLAQPLHEPAEFKPIERLEFACPRFKFVPA